MPGRDTRPVQYDILAYRMHPGTLPLGWVSVISVVLLVSGPLGGVVHEAFQPTQVSMWLAEAGSDHDTGSVRG